MQANRRFLVLAAAALCLALAPAIAPAEGLANKTIRLSWFQQTPGNEVGTTNGAGGAGRNVTLTLYVSSTGRVFTKAAGQTGKFTGKKSIGPENTAFQVQGNKLTGVYKQGTNTNNATSVTVTFAAGLESCSVEIILGSEDGKPLTWVGLNGKHYIATGHPKISNQSCAVSSGNPFAG